MEKGKANAKEDSSGVPRGWSLPHSLSAMADDADPVESFLWTVDPTPNLPRTHRRVKHGAAGRVAILRDTSMSMQGMWNNWASLLCTSVMELAQKQKMRVGYIEFNSRAQKFVDPLQQQFFTKEYVSLNERMSTVKVEGLTNYEAPLSIALDEFQCQSIAMNSTRQQRQRGRQSKQPRQSFPESRNNRNHRTLPTQTQSSLRSTLYKRKTDQHILFITDGQPTSGDRQVRIELARAQDLGVSVHTVFIGYRACPTVLDRLSLTTGGSRWATYFCPHKKTIRVVDRESHSFDAHGKDMELRMVDRMTRMPTVFQRYLDENDVLV